MNRIVITGASGSGKTTLASQIGAIMQISMIDLDALSWLSDWQKASDALFEERLTQAIQPDQWVVSGNYSVVRPILWSKADTIIWLDYPFRVNLFRLVKRTTKRVVTKEQLWGTNNYEDLRRVFSQDSIILWLFKSYSGFKHKIPNALAQPEYQHLRLIHHRHPRDTQQFLSMLQQRINENSQSN